MTELELAGYEYAGEKTCRCGGRIIWFWAPKSEWKRPRNPKWVPLTILKDSRFVLHHSVCKRIEEFRRLKKEREQRAEEKRQRSLF